MQKLSNFKLEKKSRTRQKFLPYFVAALLWAVWISGIFGNSGIWQVYRLSNARFELSQRVKALENEKSQLATTLNQLQNDPQVQQKAIRDVLGHVKPNELVFEFH